MQTEARRRGSSIEADASIVSPAEVVEQAQKAMKDAAAVRSQNDELKHKLEVQRIENNQLNTTLKREIGDGDLFNAAIAGEGWRGRAQQITLLKTKVKRLERELRNGGHGSPGTQNFQRSRDAKDVDARAEAHVKSISTARQALLASQREEIAQLKAEQKESRQRLDAARSRLSTAQTDAARLRGQMKVMIDKADTDDSLIQELREQLSQTRRAAGMGGGSIALALGSTGGSSSGASPKAASHGAPRSSKSNDDLRAEIERLKKLTKRQGDVIDRQERTISGLRSELHDVQAHVRG
uniref:Uncharacterized protein n=2 Tax=Phaeomonas parva TaxID=124430 RepID=A0A6U4GQ49_9STRA|mmetsp:Transcript_32044/g.101981  ORF Transcript_32044/g.101981 Transcript_32044/m.101981 type:complete len:296 (+) Transcript_32044:645-1532(+)